MSMLALLNLRTASYNTPNNISDQILEDVSADEKDVYGILNWVKLKPEFVMDKGIFQEWCYNFVNRLTACFKQNSYSQEDITILSRYLFSLYLPVSQDTLIDYRSFLEETLELTPSQEYSTTWLCQEEIRLLYLQLLNLQFEDYVDEIMEQLTIANENAQQIREVRENL